MEITIEYIGKDLEVEGYIEKADESVGIFQDSFIAEEVRENGIIITEDFLEEDFEDIEELCLKAVGDRNQTNWENANV